MQFLTYLFDFKQDKELTALIVAVPGSTFALINKHTVRSVDKLHF